MSLSDMKSDVLHHMETIAQSYVKASVSFHRNWIFCTLHGFNAWMLWGSLVFCLFLCWWEHPAMRTQLPTLHTWKGSFCSNLDPACSPGSLDPPASPFCLVLGTLGLHLLAEDFSLPQKSWKRSLKPRKMIHLATIPLFLASLIITFPDNHVRHLEQEAPHNHKAEDILIVCLLLIFSFLLYKEGWGWECCIYQPADGPGQDYLPPTRFTLQQTVKCLSHVPVSFCNAFSRESIMTWCYLGHIQLVACSMSPQE